MDNQEKQSVVADPFEESLRQILSNDSAGKGGLPAASAANRAGASYQAVGMSLAERRAAEDAAAAAKIQTEQKILFWMNLFRPLALITVLILLGWFVLRISGLGG